MTLVAAAVDAPIASSKVARAASVGCVAGKVRTVHRRLGRPISVSPVPSSVFVLAHRLPFAAISQNVAKGDEQQECNQRSNDQQDFQGSLLKSGSYQNV